ncbi:MAG: hypothetical protein JSW11_00395 [Candidatus Heimdallarchaeota archaeon]|nr:MAG: hypothetical protein JSW11_00395 [Candidatus Heimdallarchaeota archaeon]
MNVGDTVKINRCEVCPKVVGKTVKVVEVGENGIVVSFGRGRPQKDRPRAFSFNDVSLVDQNEQKTTS